MLSCQDVSQLVCESLDRKLPLSKRIGLYMHLMVCSLCRRNARQIWALHASLAKACEEMPAQPLSDAAKQAMKNLLR